MYTLCALALALSSLSPAQASPKIVADPDLKEMSTYTLTMDIVNKVARVNQALIDTMKQDPKYVEQVKLQKELDAIKKKDEPTEADDKRMDEIQARLQTLEEQNKSPLDMNNAKDLNEMAAAIQAFPPLMNLLRKEGMTGRDYAKFILATIQAGFTAGLQKQGLLKTTPEGVNPANVKFILEHEEELKKLQAGGGMQ